MGLHLNHGRDIEGGEGVLSEEEIKLLNLFRRVDDLDRLSIISLLESRPKAASSSTSTLTLIHGGRGVHRPSAGSVTNEGAASLVARSI